MKEWLQIMQNSIFEKQNIELIQKGPSYFYTLYFISMKMLQNVYLQNQFISLMQTHNCDANSSLWKNSSFWWKFIDVRKNSLLGWKFISLMKIHHSDRNWSLWWKLIILMIIRHREPKSAFWWNLSLWWIHNLLKIQQCDKNLWLW